MYTQYSTVFASGLAFLPPPVQRKAGTAEHFFLVLEVQTLLWPSFCRLNMGTPVPLHLLGLQVLQAGLDEVRSSTQAPHFNTMIDTLVLCKRDSPVKISAASLTAFQEAQGFHRYCIFVISLGDQERECLSIYCCSDSSYSGRSFARMTAFFCALPKWIRWPT